MLCLGCCRIGCVPATTCVKSQMQCCCCVESVAFPPDSEVPCMCAHCGLACYPKVACCSTIPNIMGK